MASPLLQGEGSGCKFCFDRQGQHVSSTSDRFGPNMPISLVWINLWVTSKGRATVCGTSSLFSLDFITVCTSFQSGHIDVIYLFIFFPSNHTSGCLVPSFNWLRSSWHRSSLNWFEVRDGGAWRWVPKLLRLCVYVGGSSAAAYATRRNICSEPYHSAASAAHPLHCQQKRWLNPTAASHQYHTLFCSPPATYTCFTGFK